MAKNHIQQLKTIPILILLSLLALTIFLASFQTKSTHKSENKTIKVLSYNIHYGLGMDKKLDLKRIANVILSHDPDLVGLQEIGDSTMTAELGKLTGMKSVFGQSLGRMDGYGDAILSKHPLKWVNNYSIPSASSSRYQAMGVDVDLSGIYQKGTVVRLINTHFDWLKTIGSQEARLATVEVIERGFFTENANISAILTGDLNAVPESLPLQKLEQKGWVQETLGKDLKTIGSQNPRKQIDYVLVRPRKNWKIIDIEVLNEPIASDHLPILLTIELLQD